MPDSEHEKLRYIALCWGGGLGPAGFWRLVNTFGSAREVLAADVAALRNPALRLTPEQLAIIPTLSERLEDFEEEVAGLRAEGVFALCPFDESYPALLRDLPSPPPVLCMAGRVLPQDEPAVAIVGTRSPTPEGYDMSRALAQAFAQENTTVVSGLARGCDTAAHRGALDGGGRTLAILGSGIRVIHPRENWELAREISQRGAVMSEQPPTAHPTVGRLMARNRLQSALSRGVLIVESREEGGAMETARQARDQGRLVFAVDWPGHNEEALGPQRLLREGAEPVRGPEDVPRLRLELVDHIARMERRRVAAGGQQTLF